MTVDGKAYYRITSMLKQIGLSFLSLVPGTILPRSIILAISTKSEASLITDLRPLTIEAFGDVVLLKQEIIRKLYGQNIGPITIGIDPGSRIGVVAFYGRAEIYSEVLLSPAAAIENIAKLVRSNPHDEKIIRIGNGSYRLTTEIAQGLIGRLGQDARIEIVDEHGTSSQLRSRPKSRGSRDIRSAGLIAFREGRRFDLTPR